MRSTNFVANCVTPAERRTVSLADDGPPNSDDREEVASEAGGREKVAREEASCEEAGREEASRETGRSERGRAEASTALVRRSSSDLGARGEGAQPPERERRDPT